VDVEGGEGEGGEREGEAEEFQVRGVGEVLGVGVE
jgi:hypothetical protein